MYTYLYTVTTRMTCIKMGSDESQFNVSLIVRDKVTGQCPQTIIFEEKGEPKRYRTEVLPLTSLPLGQTGSQKQNSAAFIIISVTPATLTSRYLSPAPFWSPIRTPLIIMIWPSGDLARRLSASRACF